MALSTLANLLLPLTVALSLVTLVIGLCACPMQSLELQHQFVYFSAATVVLAIASLLRHGVRSKPYRRVYRIEYGLAPLACFWIYLLMTYISVGNIREAGARFQMMNNGKEIGLAVHFFHDDNKQLPADLRDDGGAAVLSWRVSILPYIEHGPLYKQFTLAKPWDSPANLPLLEKIPATYPSIFREEPGKTPWQGFVGPGTAFETGNAKLNFNRDFPDGTSNTILVVEATEQVPWSKPADIPYGANLPLPPLGLHYVTKGDWPFCCPVQRAPRFMMCMADGTVRMVSAEISEATMRALIVRNDGKHVEVPD